MPRCLNGTGLSKTPHAEQSQWNAHRDALENMKTENIIERTKSIVPGHVSGQELHHIALSRHVSGAQNGVVLVQQFCRGASALSKKTQKLGASRRHFAWPWKIRAADSFAAQF